MAEASGPTLGLIQHIHYLPFGLFMTGNDHLGYPLPVLTNSSDERLIRITRISPR